MTNPPNIAEQLCLLRENYAQQLPAKLAQLEGAFRRHDNVVELPQLRHLAHSLAGSGATFGYPALSIAARQLETIVDGALNDGRPLSLEESDSIARLIEALDRGARTPIAPSSVPALPPSTVPEAERKLIYLVEDDASLATDLMLQLGHFGYTVKIFETPKQLLETPVDPLLAVVLMDIVFPQGDLAGPEAIIQLSIAKQLRTPVIFFSFRNDLTARLAAARAGGAAYLVKPIDVGTLIGRLDDLISDLPPEPYRVLIVDDNGPLATHHAFTLQSAGISTDIVTDPMTILAHLDDFKPDLVLMDMYMPKCTGSELAAVIRQLDNYVLVPIVYLSTESDTDRRLIAMQLGADDFLTKPIMPEHLISAVSTRLRRYRVLRSHIEQDSLTGLLNHAATKDRLTTETARATRQQRVFCLAALDLDNFKNVNDTYGHLIGDSVLKNLAELLKRRLRRTDIVGRIGGEEFVVILPDTNAKQAFGLLNELREAFSLVHQRASRGLTFTTTFSCGIAQYQLGASANDVHLHADEALYRAKQAGRNQVTLADDDERQDSY
ncbi:diguanylate cyclase [Dyella flava]|uniref:diguanylate cyclase n=1 Tax=Dyella flava TaxID=1920170 RepID=A0ABS2JZ54_9GAMM|nr:diguanylate cyclase [Dyella flava]MBM7123904.1 diguanylate cyclase [Dyella flava]GLQ52569.1 diguanylate cyclase [Dyella flava]